MTQFWGGAGEQHLVKAAVGTVSRQVLGAVDEEHHVNASGGAKQFHGKDKVLKDAAHLGGYHQGDGDEGQGGDHPPQVVQRHLHPGEEEGVPRGHHPPADGPGHGDDEIVRRHWDGDGEEHRPGVGQQQAFPAHRQAVVKVGPLAAVEPMHLDQGEEHRQNDHHAGEGHMGKGGMDVSRPVEFVKHRQVLRETLEHLQNILERKDEKAGRKEHQRRRNVPPQVVPRQRPTLFFKRGYRCSHSPPPPFLR